ncbi:MAG: putative PEP-binding protein [Caldilineaceae bacterium]
MRPRNWPRIAPPPRPERRATGGAYAGHGRGQADPVPGDRGGGESLSGPARHPFSLAERSLLHVQLRALLRAAADHPLAVMFPMVSTLDELRQRARWARPGARWSRTVCPRARPHSA